MDLSKAYDCIPHDLLIAKLEAYGLDKISLNILFDYLNNRKQRTKIGCSFSSWYDIITGIPQGSILGPLLFNIFINDLFLLQIKSEICNFADDNTLYSCDKELGTVISNLKYDMTNILNWFRYNSMKANPDKFQFMILGPSDDKCFILKINAIEIRNTSEVELLGLTIDHKLKFDAHIDKLCKTARFKLHALRRIRKLVTLEQAKLLANSFVNTQFGYAPLIWMFTSKNSMLKINKIHRRTLRVVYDDYNSTYEELLASHNDISIHQKHLKHLAIEVYKSLTNLNPEFMWPFFKNKSIPYNLRNGNICILPLARASHYGINSVQFRGRLLWNNLPTSVKEIVSVKEFKQKLDHVLKIHGSCIACRRF